MNIRFFTVPNILTLSNLICGCLATLYALRFDDLQIAFALVVAAAVFDFLDGFSARLFHSYSELGKQLDSLSDMVSFGVTPSAVLLSIYQAAGGIGAWGFVVFVLAAFSALRLAKFNIDDSQTEEFEGMPTPACALFVTAAGYLYAAGLYDVRPLYVLIVALGLSWLLISPVRMFALKFHSYALKGNELRYGFVLLAVLALVVWQIVAIPFIILAYILVSVVRDLVCRAR